MFLGGMRMVNIILQNNGGRIYFLIADFITTNAVASLATFFQFSKYILAQAGATVACHHMVRRYITDDAVDAAIRLNAGFDVRNELDQFFLSVGLILTFLPIRVQFCSFQ